MQQKELEGLLAKQEITETFYRFMRGIDRLDRELVLSCFHPGATTDFGRLFQGSAAEMYDWIAGNHAHICFSCHQVTNFLIELEGDSAFSEGYLLTSLRMDATSPTPGTSPARAKAATRQGDLRDVFFLNRYIDHWSRRNGRWAMHHHVQVEEFSHPFDVAAGPFADAPPNPRTFFDKRDAVYVEREAWKGKLPR